MIISNFFRALKYMATSGGNFKFIAKNIATIYYVINNSEFGKQLPESQKLFATALCDTMAYTFSGKLSEDDIMEAVFTGTVIAEGSRGLYKKYENMKNRDLINVTMQIEALIFSVDTNVSPTDIINSVINNRKKIATTVNKTLSLGEKCDIYSVVYDNVNIWINDKDFRELVYLYDDDKISRLRAKFGKAMSEMYGEN